MDIQFHRTNIIETRDGSHSLYSEQFNTLYHSLFGAIEESKHVFIQQGLKPLLDLGKTEITILEIGFGTGLNALLTLKETINKPITVNYHTVEFYPVAFKEIAQLNYINNNERFISLFYQMHSQEWNTEQDITPQFIFTKYLEKIEHFKQSIQCDLIYFDAFSPREQPELWTEDVFKNMYAMLKQNACLVTYCAQGQMKRNMKAAGLSVKALAGFANKIEMTLAIKQ